MPVELPGAFAPASPGVWTGRFWDYGGRVFNVMAAGAKGDAKVITDAVMNGSNAVLTSASNPFVSTDVGKLCVVPGAGAAGVPLSTTIASYQSAGQVTLTASSLTAVSNATAAPATFGTDDFTAIQAAITAAQLVYGEVEIPPVLVGYMISAVLLVSAPITIRGGGVRALFGSIVGNPNSAWFPVIAPYLTGSVLIPAATNTDCLKMTAAGITVHLRYFGTRFAGLYNSTGHGFNVTPPADGSHFDQGLIDSHWSGLAVYGHDGNHVAYRELNCLLHEQEHLRSYGGGGLFMRNDSSRNQNGNTVTIDYYGHVFCGGTAHGIDLQASASGGNNEILHVLVRPETAMFTPSPAVVGSTPPLAGQFTILVDANTKFIEYVGPDFEQNVGSGANTGSAGQRTVGGIGTGGAMYLVPNYDADTGLGIHQRSATQAGDLFYAATPLATAKFVRILNSGALQVGAAGATAAIIPNYDGVNGLIQSSAGTTGDLYIRAKNSGQFIWFDTGTPVASHDMQIGNSVQGSSRPRLLISQNTAPIVGSGGAGTSALSILSGSSNMSGRFQVTLTGVTAGTVLGVVAFDGGPLATAPATVLVSLSAPTAGAATPLIAMADTYTTSGFTIRAANAPSNATYVINFWVIF